MSLHDEKILGLTVRSPWAELIARGIKPIENRSWPPYDFMLGRHLAIHASPTWDGFGVQYMRDHVERFAVHPPLQVECVYGVIAVARLVGWVQRQELGTPPKTIKMLPGYAFGDNLDEHGTSLDWRWLGAAEYGWVLRDVVRISPVACAGRQKLWKLSKYVYSSVRARYAGEAAAINQARRAAEMLGSAGENARDLMIPR